MTFIKFLLIGLGLFFTLKIIGQLLRVFSQKYRGLRQLNDLLPAIALCLWLVFTFWAIHSLLRNHFIYPVLTTSILLVVIIMVSWFLIKDFMAGVIFKAQNKFKPGQKIRFGDISGTILAFRPNVMELKSNNGEVMKIPYSKLSGEPIAVQGDTASTDSFSMQIRLPQQKDKDILIKEVKNTLLHLPWVSVTTTPMVNSTGEEEGHFVFEVSYHSLNARHAYFVEKALKAKFVKTP